MATTETNGTAQKPANGAANGDSNVPEWLEAELFEDMLKATVPNYKRLLNFKAKRAMAAGENYATIMLSLDIEVELNSGETKNLSYMLKVPIPSMKEFMGDHNVFAIEAAMYQQVVPELEQLYRDAGVQLKFGAQFYAVKAPDIADGVICLEDLRVRGFKNANRLEGLDMEHMQCVLKKLAQWHAASAVRVATKGPYEDSISKGFFTNNSVERMKQMMQSLSTVLMKCAKTYEGHEVYIEDMQKIQDTILDKLMSAANNDENEFNVLNHGDAWCNNVMFQYDAFGKIKETYLVDYQIPKYGTPAQDLLYFLLSSAKLEIKLKQFEYFVKYYYDNLIENLKLLKYSKKLPSLRDIHIQLYKYGVWGYTTCTGVMTAVLLDPNENATLDNFLGDSEDGQQFKYLMYSNPRYRKHIEKLLPWLHNRGALEC